MKDFGLSKKRFLIIFIISISSILVSSNTVPAFADNFPNDAHHNNNLNADTKAILLKFSGNGGSPNYMGSALKVLEDFMAANEGTHHDSAWNKFHYPDDKQGITYPDTVEGGVCGGAGDCNWIDAKQQALAFIDANPDKKIVLAGYSFGGGAATFLGYDLGNQGRQVEGIHLTDPVGPGVLSNSRAGIMQVCAINNLNPIDLGCIRLKVPGLCSDHFDSNGEPFKLLFPGIVCGKTALCPSDTTLNAFETECVVKPTGGFDTNTCPFGMVNTAINECGPPLLAECSDRGPFKFVGGRIVCGADKSCPSGTGFNLFGTLCTLQPPCPSGTQDSGFGECIASGICPPGFKFIVDGGAVVKTCGKDVIPSVARSCPSGVSYNFARTFCTLQPPCPSGTVEFFGECTTVGTCPSGFKKVGGAVTCGKDEIPGQAARCPSGTSFNFLRTLCTLQPPCPSGTADSGFGECVATNFSCPPGFKFIVGDGSIVRTCGKDIQCPSGTTLNGIGTECVVKPANGPGTNSCPPGMVESAINECGPLRKDCSEFGDGSFKLVGGVVVCGKDKFCPVDTTLNLLKTACVVQPSVINFLLDGPDSPTCIGGIFGTCTNTCPFGMDERFSPNECNAAQQAISGPFSPDRKMNSNIKGIFVSYQIEDIIPFDNIPVTGKASLDGPWHFSEWAEDVSGVFSSFLHICGITLPNGDPFFPNFLCHSEMGDLAPRQTEFINHLKTLNAKPTISITSDTQLEIMEGQVGTHEIKTISKDNPGVGETIGNMRLFPRLDSLDNGVEPTSVIDNGVTSGKQATFVLNLDDIDGPATIRKTVWVEDNGWPCDNCSTNNNDGGATGKWDREDFIITIKNAPPTPVIDVLTNVFTDRHISVQISATDPSNADTQAGFTYEVDWGDGTTESITEPTNLPLTLEHDLTKTESTITVTAKDKDGGEGQTSIDIILDRDGDGIADSLDTLPTKSSDFEDSPCIDGVLDPDTGTCTLDTSCPADTVFNSDTGLCETTTQSCPVGTELNTGTGLCESTAVSCPDGSELNAETGLCEANPCPTDFDFNSVTILCEKDVICPENTSFNSMTNSCEGPPNACPVGLVFNDLTNLCEATLADCPTGSVLNSVTNLCEASKCSNGSEFDSSTDQCVGSLTCPDNSIFNQSTQLCELSLNCPPGSDFNASTNLCEALACPSTHPLNPVTNKCEGTPGTTDGQIVDSGDQNISILEEQNSDGIFFNADEGGGDTPATIIACEKAGEIKVDSGDSGNITCGSITVSIISGSVDVQFNTSSGPATTTMGATDSLSFDGTLKFTNNSLTTPAVITIRGSTFTLDPGETLTITFPTSKTSYQDPNLGDVRHGEGHDNGFCMNQNCINVDGFFNHFPETIVRQGSTQTFSLLINCPRGTNTCNHASIEGVLPDSDFYEEQWGVTLDRVPRSDTWETTINNPYGEIGEVTTTVQEVDQTFLSVSFNIEFLIPGSIGTADGIGVPHENNRHLHVTVWDSNRGISNYIFNEGVYVDDIYAYPKVETSYETPLEIEKLCLDSNTNKRYTCAFDKVREWTIKNAEKALLEIEGKTELDVLNEEFLSKFKELKQAIADEDSEKISELRAQLVELGSKIHNQKQ